jgi:alpha-tubulin suppressor-like RCC1 family protein
VLEDGGAALDRASLIANGNHFSCAARSNPHTLECWGQNLHHALADDTCPECVDGFTAWTARATIFDSRSLTIGPISLGNDFGCARLENDELWCWGGNALGQVGTGSDEPWLPPSLVLENAATFAVGFAHVCAISDEGEILCWGDNATGALGDGTTLDRPTPKPLDPICP